MVEIHDLIGRRGSRVVSEAFPVTCCPGGTSDASLSSRVCKHLLSR